MRRLDLLVIAVLGAAVVAIIAVESGSGSRSGSDPVDSALGVLPADAEAVAIVDAAGARESLGHGDLTSTSSESEIGEYVADTAEAPWTSSELAPYFRVMDDWGWSLLDVEWEAYYAGSEASAWAVKLRDDLDMGVVEASFEEHGYDRSETAGYPSYSVDLDQVDVDTGMIAALARTIVLPDRHLILFGAEPERLVEAATGEVETLADTGTASGLVNAVDAPEYLTLSLGESSCLDPVEQLGTSAPPETVEAFRADLEETPGYPDLRGMVGHAAAITTEDAVPTARAVVEYADSETAAADVEPRQAVLDNAASLLSGQPYADLLGAEAESDGPFVRYEFGSDEATLRLPEMVRNDDLPWAFCPPES